MTNPRFRALEKTKIGRYTPEDLRACFSFVQRDFERFLDLLLWLESLKEPDRREQLKSAQALSVSPVIPLSVERKSGVGTKKGR